MYFKGVKVVWFVVVVRVVVEVVGIVVVVEVVVVVVVVVEVVVEIVVVVDVNIEVVEVEEVLVSIDVGVLFSAFPINIYLIYLFLRVFSQNLYMIVEN